MRAHRTSAPADVQFSLPPLRWARSEGRIPGNVRNAPRGGHAHRVLSKALCDASRYDLVVKNVAAEEGAPKVAGEEMIILTED
jgi:hypothetical protein